MSPRRSFADHYRRRATRVGLPVITCPNQDSAEIFLRKDGRRKRMYDDPFMHILRLTESKNPKLSSYINALYNCDDFIEKDKLARAERVRTSSRTKSSTYYALNPSLGVHPIYKGSDEVVDDYLRIAFTRLRTSSHRLKIETGRWSRIPRERRLCQCGKEVQTEEHILMNCDLTRPIKEKYKQIINCFQTFMITKKTKVQLCMLHEILESIENWYPF